MELTVSGLEHVYDVVELVYEYIYSLGDSFCQESFFTELAQVSHMSLQFKSKQNDVDSIVSKLAGNMTEYKPGTILLLHSNA